MSAVYHQICTACWRQVLADQDRRRPSGNPQSALPLYYHVLQYSDTIEQLIKLLFNKSCIIYPMVPFPVTLSDTLPRFQGHDVIFMPTDAFSVSCAQLTRNLLATAKIWLVFDLMQ